MREKATSQAVVGVWIWRWGAWGPSALASRGLGGARTWTCLSRRRHGLGRSRFGVSLLVGRYRLAGESEFGYGWKGGGHDVEGASRHPNPIESNMFLSRRRHSAPSSPSACRGTWSRLCSAPLVEGVRRHTRQGSRLLRGCISDCTTHAGFASFRRLCDPAPSREGHAPAASRHCRIPRSAACLGRPPGKVRMGATLQHDVARQAA